MADGQVRIEIGFHGGQVLRVQVPPADADELHRKLQAGDGGVAALTVEDGTCLVAVAHVLYMTRHDRESRVGFGSA